MLYPVSPTITFLAMTGVAALAFVVIPRKVDAFLLKRC
ncbi:putative 3-phenylpropionic acid transporter [Pasteurella multocida subsp. multocida str. Anand1_buffalo]|nr:putative 3-phenylpropionic acid transporter [Pasteurella multocida subsp. multocida str. Anand1_buffalo]